MAAKKSDDTVATYVAETAPSLGIKLKGKRYQFRNKVLEFDLTNEDQKEASEELDKFLADPDKQAISSMVRKFDRAQAEAMAKAHMEQMQSMLGTFAGQLDSGASQHVMRGAQIARDMRAISNTQEAESQRAALEHSGEMLPVENVEPSPAAQVADTLRKKSDMEKKN